MPKYNSFEECIEKLNTLSKEDLIEFIRFISHGYFEKGQFNLGLAYVKDKRKIRLNEQLFSEAQTAQETSTKAVDEYFSYLQKLIDDYGQNGTFEKKLVPIKNLETLNRLKLAMYKAMEDATKANDKWFKNTKTTKK